MLPILIFSGLNEKLHLFSLDAWPTVWENSKWNLFFIELCTHFINIAGPDHLKGLFQPKWFYDSAKFLFTWTLHKDRASPASLESLIADLNIVLLQKFKCAHMSVWQSWKIHIILVQQKMLSAKRSLWRYQILLINRDDLSRKGRYQKTQSCDPLKHGIPPWICVLPEQDVVSVTVVTALRWIPCCRRLNQRKSLHVLSSSKTECAAYMIVVFLSSIQIFTICTYMVLHIGKTRS